ncbi:hypothetical protein GGR54DRAFT_153275 [Hypoxylon sp. NC1633]|nr:hypothetical protein GGR54DRAFT_153275 [Hypoxylon sp. NC1633]
MRLNPKFMSHPSSSSAPNIAGPRSNHHTNAQEPPSSPEQRDTPGTNPNVTKPPTTFADLPPEVREMVWQHALPEPRVFNVLVYASAGLKMQLLERDGLRLPLAHVCFESRQFVRKAGYVLAFRDEDSADDPGVWFHPRRDVIERTLWGPADSVWR